MQAEWHRGQKGRDYCGEYCRYQKLLPLPVPHTPGLQAARQQIQGLKPVVSKDKLNGYTICQEKNTDLMLKVNQSQ